MNASPRERVLSIGLSLAAGGAFYFFYLKYVPLVGPFQLVLVPILLACFLLAAVRLEWGVLFFVFCFLCDSIPIGWTLRKINGKEALEVQVIP